MTVPPDDADMMTQQLGFSILCAPLAAIDRRALSQAWYSALHIAQHARMAQPDVRVLAHARGAVAPPHGDVVQERASSLKRGVAPARRGSVGRARVSGAPERRAERSALARRIEHTFLNPFVRPRRATFTIEGSRERVHIAIQTTVAGMRIIAVCPASMQPRVARALEEARYALAACGIALQPELREV